MGCPKTSGNQLGKTIFLTSTPSDVSAIPIPYYEHPDHRSPVLIRRRPSANSRKHATQIFQSPRQSSPRTRFRRTCRDLPAFEPIAFSGSAGANSGPRQPFQSQPYYFSFDADGSALRELSERILPGRDAIGHRSHAWPTKDAYPSRSTSPSVTRAAKHGPWRIRKLDTSCNRRKASTPCLFRSEPPDRALARRAAQRASRADLRSSCRMQERLHPVFGVGQQSVLSSIRNKHY